MSPISLHFSFEWLLEILHLKLPSGDCWTAWFQTSFWDAVLYLSLHRTSPAHVLGPLSNSTKQNWWHFPVTCTSSPEVVDGHNSPSHLSHNIGVFHTSLFPHKMTLFLQFALILICPLLCYENGHQTLQCKSWDDSPSAPYKTPLLAKHIWNSLSLWSGCCLPLPFVHSLLSH